MGFHIEKLRLDHQLDSFTCGARNLTAFLFATPSVISKPTLRKL